MQASVTGNDSRNPHFLAYDHNELLQMTRPHYAPLALIYRTQLGYLLLEEHQQKADR